MTVHEMKRLARNATELMTLEAVGIQLELLTGPLTAIYTGLEEHLCEIVR